MRLVFKFFVPLIIITLLLSAFVLHGVANQVRENSLKRAQLVAADYIDIKAREFLTTENFNDANYSNQYDNFEKFMNLIKTKDIIKIKVFNKNSDIIFSTAKENIGQKTDSPNYVKALNGEIAVMIKPPEKEQANIDLKGYKQVMEIYVPIVYGGKVEGVIETYYKMDYVNEDITNLTTGIITWIGIYSMVLLLLIYGLLHFTILKPISLMKTVADKVSKGDSAAELTIKSKDEIGELGKSFNRMLAAVKFFMQELGEKGKK